MDWKKEAIEQLRWHWENQARPRLDGLTDDEYFWEPVPGCWTIHRRDEQRTSMQAGAGEWVYDFELPDPDPAPITTIAWRLGHIIASVFGLRAANHFGTPWADNWWDTYEWPSTAADALERVDTEYDAWIKGISSLDDEAMTRAVGPTEGPWQEFPYSALILHINREVIHHSAEVALLRDLYRAKAAA